MSQFTPSFKFETEFDGDTVTCQMRRLKRKHLAVLAPVIHTDAEGGTVVRFNLNEFNQMLEVAAQVIPECVVEGSFKGLKDANGNTIDLQTALEENYFAPLLAKMLEELMLKSTVSQDVAKKSAPASSGSLEAVEALLEGRTAPE